MMQKLLQSNLELQAEKLKNEFKEKERDFQNQISTLNKQGLSKDQDIEELTIKLNAAERATKIECEKIEVSYRR